MATAPIHPDRVTTGVPVTPATGAAPKKASFYAKLPKLESLKSQARAISRKCVDLLNDEQLICLIVSFLGVAIRGLQFAGNIGGEFLPYLGILSSPFRLYHAARSANGRLKLLMCAASTGQVAEAIFWFARSVDTVGKGISSSVKPFAGGVQLAGASVSHMGLGVTFTLVLPIVLIACGAVGGVAKGWATLRTAQVLRQFNQETEKQDGTLKALGEVLDYLQGPVPDVLEGSKQSILAEKYFNENHFTNDSRREALQQRAAQLMQKNPVNIWSYVERLHALKRTEVYGLHLASASSQLQLIDELITVYDKILAGESTGITGEMRCKRAELVALKQELMQEGEEIIGTVRSEIHRKLLYHTVLLIIAVLTVTSGSLLLVPHLHTAGYALSMSSGGLFVLYILFDKLVSQERFYKIDRFLQRNQPSG